ncbi:unnamed protein product [Phytophthora lilii]|uniref:Unnamed protein product n=1 Tax=Phytophthora lilii TaxID=2077276 RepID=A0A9W6X262_9STRA|nr:unnamed protein product [Phytophthora lilii]
MLLISTNHNVPRGRKVRSHRRHYAEPAVIAQEIISPWAVELLNRRTQPGTPPPASPAAPVDNKSKGDSPQSFVAAAAVLVGAASSTGDVSEASFTDTPAGSSRPRPDLSDLADAATAASL